MSDVVLLRHGSTALNVEGRVQGWVDPDLNARGVDQALRAGRLLGRAGFRPKAVWSSDLVRARRTAELAWPGRPVRTDPRLRELHFGAWEGRLWNDLRAAGGEVFRAWSVDPERTAPPGGGETLAELRARLDEWRTCLEGPGVGRPAAVVVHGGPIRVLTARLLGLSPPWRVLAGLRLPPGGAVRLGAAAIDGVRKGRGGRRGR